MAFDKEESLFLARIGAGQADEARKMIVEHEAEDKGWTSLPLLAAAMAEAAKACQPETMALISSYYWGSRDSQTAYQMYSKSYMATTRGGSVPQFQGENAWKFLIESGAEPDSPRFIQCSKLLCETSVSINAPLRMHANVADDASTVLLHELASRGWTGLAKGIESWKGKHFQYDGKWGADTRCEISPLEYCLAFGRGEFAHWLASQGASKSMDVCWRAMQGFSTPAKLAGQGFQAASDADRLLALRVGVHMGGLASFESYRFAKVSDEPLASKQSLAAWLMIRGGRAQALGLPKDARVRAVCSLLVEAKSEKDANAAKKLRAEVDKALSAPPADASSPAPPKLGFFAILARGKAKDAGAAAIDPHGGAALLAEARAAVEERSAAAPDIVQAIACLDGGDFPAAQSALENLPQGQRLSAAVALLGLAKMGFWDMPAPGGVGGSVRHPQRWAGFKMCAKIAGLQLDMAIPGLGGLSLMGACAAIGWPDACAALMEAGASPDADPLTESASPLSLAIKYGNFEIAKALVQAGAAPLEGAKPSAFGFEPKAWALHAAFDAKRVDLIQALLEADPRCSELPDPSGKTLFERALAACEEGASGGREDFAHQVRSMAERAGMRSQIDIPIRKAAVPAPEPPAARAPTTARSSSL